MSCCVLRMRICFVDDAMYGVVTLLDADHLVRFSEVWESLARSCPDFNRQVAPLPHFSWHIAEGYDLLRLQQLLSLFAREAPTFTVRCSGLGLFTGPKPILYIRLVKDDRLEQLQRQLYKQIFPISSAPSPFYSPQAWVPHISLANDIPDSDLLACAMRNLAFQVYNWEIRVDHLTIGYQDEQQEAEILQRYSFYG
jgi:2'-5' RNA ligase